MLKLPAKWLIVPGAAAGVSEVQFKTAILVADQIES
jgi:hypothetical protein